MTKGMPWFRLYHRIIDDDKIRLLAFEDRWHFIALCCLKAEGLLDQTRDAVWERRVAVKLGIQTRELEEMARRLREVGLIDEAMNPVAWDELQMRSDNSTERVRSYRERQKKQGLAVVKQDETVSVTTQERDTDTEREEEKYILPKAEKRAAKLPKAWEPKLTPRSQAIVAKWPAGKFEVELQKFRDHAADKGRTSKDWQAAFRTWINNADEWMKGNGRRNQAPVDQRDGFTAAIDRRLYAGDAEGASR